MSPGSDPTDRAVDTIAADSSLAAQSIIGRSSFSVQAMQHGGSDRHLPATRQNIELVGKLQVNTPAQYRYNPATGLQDSSQPAVVPEQIADLAVYKSYAYLNSWDEPSCKRGGIFVGRHLQPGGAAAAGLHPGAAGQLPRRGRARHHARQPSFRGDLLAVNNEPYTHRVRPGRRPPAASTSTT